MTAADRDREALAKALLAELGDRRILDDVHTDTHAEIGLALADIAHAHAHARAQVGEPVAWQYRMRQYPTDKWSSWLEADAMVSFRPNTDTWQSRALYDRPAPAQEPVAVPAGDDDYRSTFEKVAASDGLDVASWDDDEGMYDDSDTQWCWQGWQECLKLLRYLAAAPVHPPAESGEAERLRADWMLMNDDGKRWRICGPAGRWVMKPEGAITADEARTICETAMGTALPLPTPPAGEG